MSKIPNHLVTKHQVLSLVEGGYCTLKQASIDLDLSYRQTRRWYRRYQQTCGSLTDFTVSMPRGGGWNKLDHDTHKEIEKLKKKYPRMSSPHIADTLQMEQALLVSTSSVKRILVQKDLYHPHKHTRRVFTRFEPESFGERLQMDTTSGVWMRGYRLIYLILVIDEYSRQIVGWQWTDADSAWNNMYVLSRVFSDYGLPKMLYTDNASHFKTIRHGKSIHQNHKGEGYETQIQRAMRELGVIMFSHKPYEPQGKGKVERLNRFIQERFVQHHTCKNLDEMNRTFETWVKWYNTHHTNRTTGSKPKDRHEPSLFTPVSSEDLTRALCFKATRKVDKCNAFSFKGCTYTLPEEPILVHRTVELEYTPQTIHVYYHDQCVGTFPHQYNK